LRFCGTTTRGWLALNGTTGAIVPDDGLDGYQAALTNFRFLANDLWTSDEAVKAMSSTASLVAQ
jgi:hypothetical protein